MHLLSNLCYLILLFSDSLLFFIFQIQMIEEDRQNRSGTFCANQKGLLPPFVSTPFITEDRGMLSYR